MTTSRDGAAGERAGPGLLWGDRPARKDRPALTLDGIARAAIEIADADGLEAVSMQRVAGALGFTKMSLYRHVAGKAELTAVMIDRAAGEPPELDGVPGGWRPRIEEFARLLAATWREHPWLPWATMGDRVMGPREVGWIECAVGALAGTGLTGDEQLDAVFVLCGHIRNTQSMSSAGTQPWTTDKQFSSAIAELMREHGTSYPALTAAVACTTGQSRDNGREFGLRCFLDGLAAVIAERSNAR